VKKGTVSFAILIVIAALLLPVIVYAGDIDIERDLQSRLQKSKTIIDRIYISGSVTDSDINQLRGLRKR